MTSREAVNQLQYIIDVANKNDCNIKEIDGFDEEAIEMAIKALEQESCEDAISRQEAVEAFQMFREYESNRSNKGWVNRIETVLNQLPPVKPKPKTGHWIDFKEWYECSECGESHSYCHKYCPYCGAKMEVSNATDQAPTH